MNSENIVVCFDRLKNSSDLEIDCSDITVKGHYEEYRIDTITDYDGVCQAGTISVFYVSEWSCK